MLIQGDQRSSGNLYSSVHGVEVEQLRLCENLHKWTLQRQVASVCLVSPPICYGASSGRSTLASGRAYLIARTWHPQGGKLAGAASLSVAVVPITHVRGSDIPT